MLKFKEKKGFTLIELLIVIGIIGILSVIAVPNFMKFQLKAKQSEPKINLSGLYTAQKGFFTEWGTYTSHLEAVGWEPTGKLNYVYGFNDVKPSRTDALEQLGIDEEAYPEDPYTCYGPEQKMTGCAPKHPNQQFLGPALTAAAKASGNLGVIYSDGDDDFYTKYIAMAYGNIASDQGKIDAWSINEAKSTRHVCNALGKGCTDPKSPSAN